MNVQLVRICNTNALNISICNAKRTLKEIQKIPQPKPSPKLRILRLKIDYRPDGLIE